VIGRILLFPTSPYLRGQWWHRLATVVFWTWVLGVAIYMLKAVVINPYSACVTMKFADPGKPMDFDCGRNALDYMWKNMAATTASDLLFIWLFLIVAFYVAAILPCILYRIILYVAKGATWRNYPDAA